MHDEHQLRDQTGNQMRDQTRDSIRDHSARSDAATAAVIEEALRLCASEGIDGAIRYMEQRRLDRATILRVLCSPKFHR